MKILVIEDEKKIAEAVCDWFLAAGDHADAAYDGTSGLDKVMDGAYDCVILDIMLPGLNGFEVLKELRASGNTTPVLMLTARSDVTDKVAGLTSGAEDYLTKPFDFEELEARVRIISGKRSSLSIDDSDIAQGDLVLDSNTSRLKDRTNGKSVQLSVKEFKLMEYFMTNPTRVLTKEQIFERIWGYDTDIAYNNVEVYISFLRKKLKFLESGSTIETVRGVGYRLS